MNLKRTLIAAAIALAPVTAMAGGSLDVFYVDNELELGSESVDGSGVGFRGEAALAHGLSLTALHQLTDVEEGGDSADVTETRFGLRYDHALDKMITVGAGLESVQLSLEEDGSGLAVKGYSLSAHGALAVTQALSINAKVGYVDMGDIDGESLDGLEYQAGVAYDIDKQFGVFAEYRVVDLEIEDTDLTLDTIRLGGRMRF